ncbi:S8 family serine peptidase [Micromonospora sp. NPDC049559]|uniref:S8 family serine peptidase n=1 Tax=Micromonospora sp. NPDC049559 TaxID=3155923 RepID=UPI00344AC309
MLLGTAIGLVATGVGGAGPSVAGPPRGGTPSSGPATVLPAGRTYTVTLLTGDVVTVSTRTSGCPLVTVKPARPNGIQHRSCGPDGHAHVVPGEVAKLVGPVLDESLFDVTALILNGYDDARTSELPLIVRPAGGAPGAGRAAGTLAANPLAAGLGQRRELPVLGAVSGRQPKGEGFEFLRTLTGQERVTAGVRAAGVGPKVWLDRRVRATGTASALDAARPATGTASALDAARPATGAPLVAAARPATVPHRQAPVPDLDRNLGQIKAPQAWAAGANGRGVRVAVLDTGADFAHPDLAGQVVERADFSVEGGDAVDHLGHGTHVAATIAGTGAASGGERRGVAPEADLLVGKVLDDDGFGTDSMVIAGMEWAAPRADVVNMSLGGSDLSDGSDPLSQALDALTERYGTLFVVAAGNEPTPGWVGAPAAAASALTVGAVDGTDAPAPFSSRGPLTNSRAAKPELVAPGVDILAARAAGTTMGDPLDERYTAASGTSMATPHAAGAAALLVQRHPDWSPGRLKSALVGAADPLPGADAYAVGAGRLDAARALSGAVAGQDLVDLGTFAYPQSGTATTPLSWTNTGTAAVSLELTVSVTGHDGRSVPTGTATLSAGRVTLAAGATGTATLRVDRSRLAARPGLYAAVVTARAGGVFVASTPVAFYVEPPGHELNLTVTALPDAADGVDQWGAIQVVNLDDPTLFQEYLDLTPGSTTSVRVPAGRYSLIGYQWEDNPATGGVRMGLVGTPDLTVDRDTDLLVDAATASQLRGGVDGVATEAAQLGATYGQYARTGELVSNEFAFAWGTDARDGGVYVMPMRKPGVGRFEAYVSFSLHAPGTGPSPYLYDLVKTLPNGFPADLTYRWSAAEQADLARIDQSFRVLDRKGSVTTHKRYGWTADYLNVLEAWTDGAAGDRVDYVTPGFQWLDEAFYDGVVTQEALRRYAPGSRTNKVWVRQPLRPDWYDDPAPSTSDCVPNPVSRTRGNLHVELVEQADQHQRFSCHPGDPEWETKTVRKLTLRRDGQLVGEADRGPADFSVPRQAGNYRLEYHLDASALQPVSTRVDTAWTFRSAGPAGTNRVAVPLLSVDYALPLDVANKPTGGAATFAVRQAYGVTAQKITSFELWTSVDDGATWQPVATGPAGADTFAAQLPRPAAGQAVSLRVKATADGGSGIEQTIIRAYLAG